MPKAVKYLIFTLFAAVAVGIMILNLGFLPELAIFEVKSGSMKPKIPAGSVVVPKKFPSYEVGDIITYSSNNQLITHRVVEKTHKEGYIFYKTKGDANKNPDQDLVSQGQVIGKVVLSIPYLGRFTAFAKTPTGYLLLILIPSLYIISAELLALIQDMKNKKKNLSKTMSILLLVSAISATGVTYAFFSDNAINAQNIFTAAQEFPPPDNPWLGNVKSMGYWKNHEYENWVINDVEYEISLPIKGDYCKILANQAVAFHNNWIENPSYKGIPLQQTIFYSEGLSETYDGKSISYIHNEAEILLANCDPQTQQEREETLNLKDVLDWINNGNYIWYY